MQANQAEIMTLKNQYRGNELYKCSTVSHQIWWAVIKIHLSLFLTLIDVQG